MVKINNNTIPVEASLTTLRGITGILQHLDTANDTFKRAGFDCPYKFSKEDKVLMAFGQIMTGGNRYNNWNNMIDEKNQRKSLETLEDWQTDKDHSTIQNVFISLVDSLKSGMKFVFTPSKFGVVISRGYLLDIVGRYNNLMAEAKKATSNRNDWRRNLPRAQSWFCLRLLDMANAIGELDINVAETKVTRIDTVINVARTKSRYSYYNTNDEQMESADINPFLSQRFERESFKYVLLSTYGDFFSESILSSIKNDRHLYRSIGLPLPITQAELVYALNCVKGLKEVSK